MTGDVGDYQPGVLDDPVHDPTLFKHGKTFYVFSTGSRDEDNPGGIFVRRSTGDLAGPWASLGSIPLPERTREYDVAHLWAPHVVESGGTFHLYYAASTYGTNRSAIGLATSKTPGDLIDRGPIVTSKWATTTTPSTRRSFSPTGSGTSCTDRSGPGSRCSGWPTCAPRSVPASRWPATRPTLKTRSRTRRCSSTATTGTSLFRGTTAAAGWTAATRSLSDGLRARPDRSSTLTACR
jgi:hypothetical protein